MYALKQHLSQRPLQRPTNLNESYKKVKFRRKTANYLFSNGFDGCEYSHFVRMLSLPDYNLFPSNERCYADVASTSKRLVELEDMV